MEGTKISYADKSRSFEETDEEAHAVNEPSVRGLVEGESEDAPEDLSSRKEVTRADNGDQIVGRNRREGGTDGEVGLQGYGFSTGEESCSAEVRRDETHGEPCQLVSEKSQILLHARDLQLRERQ